MRILGPSIVSLLLFAFTGCGLTAVPNSTSPGTINLDDNSITQTRNGLTITARVADIEYAPYRIVDNITTFEVAIRNNSEEGVTLPLDSFWVFDDEGQQYAPISPERVTEIVSRDSPYLIPYPYVGYYYLEDAERFSQANTFTSSLPYYAENHPQDIFTDALPLNEPIFPGAKVSGLIYVVLELTNKSAVELQLYLPGTKKSGNPDFRFPFIIEK